MLAADWVSLVASKVKEIFSKEKLYWQTTKEYQSKRSKSKLGRSKSN